MGFGFGLGGPFGDWEESLCFLLHTRKSQVSNDGRIVARRVY